MKEDEKEKEIKFEDLAVILDVEKELIDEVRRGEVTRITLDINDDNYLQILEHIDGNVVLTTEEMPDKYYGCFYYNGGEFPYQIKETLDYVVLSSEDNDCLTKIIGIDVTPGTPFRFEGPDKPMVEDPEGDCCVWEIEFEVVPMVEGARTYLMRWNPTISSFTEKDYEECLKESVHGMFRLNWSISDWQEARRGDYFYMMRTDGDDAGIIFSGQLITDPYPDEDWAGSMKRRMYVDLICCPSDATGASCISLEQLQTVAPEIDWAKGHSGELLPSDVIEKLDDILSTPLAI